MVSNHVGPITDMSQLYETEAWGLKGQADFINQALICQTKLNPLALLEEVKKIEGKMGRPLGKAKGQHWGPRIIDVDIIFYGDKIIDKPQLKIPHSELTNRNFVLYPLLDICPEKRHPLLHKSISTLAKECADKSKVVLLKKENEI